MKRRKRRGIATLPRCVLDSGALSELTGGSQRARAWLRRIIDHNGSITVPTPVLVETVTGDTGRDAEVNRILKLLQGATPVLRAPDEATARCAGRLRYRARTDNGVDALVAAEAVGDGSPCVLLTSDLDDLSRLLANEPHVVVRAV